MSSVVTLPSTCDQRRVRTQVPEGSDEQTGSDRGRHLPAAVHPAPVTMLAASSAGTAQHATGDRAKTGYAARQPVAGRDVGGE